MSNGNVILAFAKGTGTYALSSNGVDFIGKTLSSTSYFIDQSGEVGKYCYVINDSRASKSLKAFTTNDIAATWHANLMPMPQQAAIVAIADGVTSLYFSYDGSTFRT